MYERHEACSYFMVQSVSLLQVISCFTVKLKFYKLSQHKDIQRCTHRIQLYISSYSFRFDFLYWVFLKMSGGFTSC